MTAGPVHRERWDGPERNQNAPDDVVRDVGREQRGSEQRPDDQTGRLHREDQRHQHPPEGFAGVFAHDGGGHGVVAPDADSQDEMETNESPDARRKRAGDSSSSEDKNFHAVDALAPDHVGDAAEQQRTDSGGKERRRFDQTLLTLPTCHIGLSRAMTTPMMKRS